MAPLELRMRLYVRGADLQRGGLIDTYDKLTAVARLNQPGTITVKGPTTDAALKAFENGAGLWLRDDENRTLLSGPIRARTRTVDGDGDRITLSAVSDDVWLWGRVAHPSPADMDPTTQAHDVRSGVASTVLREYVDWNAGPSAAAARQLVVLGDDPAVGASVTGRARWDPLGDLLIELAVAGGDLAFQVAQQPDVGLQFDVWEPEDLTAAVRLSIPLGTAAAWGDTTERASATYAYVAGQGEGIARTIVEGAAADDGGWGRIETFVDRRDTDDTAELEQTRDETLQEGAGVRQVDVTPADAESVVFGEHYQLGDLVTAEVTDRNGDRERLQRIVRSVTITDSPTGGTTVVPTVADAAGITRAPSTRQLDDLASRVSRLETRQ